MSQKIIKATALCLAVFAFPSCTDNFQANLDSDPIPVVYGIIHPEDSTYSVRLTKSFIGPGNALYYAKITDSIYYRDARVFLEVRSLEGTLVERVEMTEREVERREPGIFSRSPNLIYQADTVLLHLKPDWYESRGVPYQFNLHLVAEIPGLEEPVTAITRLRAVPRITEPRSAFYKVYFYGEQTFWMQWVDSNPEGYFEILVRLHYTDFLQYDEREMTAEWVLKGIQVNQTTYLGSTRTFYSYYFRPENFYSQIRAAIVDDSTVLARVARSVDFIVLSSNREMEYYRKIYEIADDYHGAGYTNISNGLGIFTTYVTNGVYGLFLGFTELDSLASGRYTGHLRFKNW
ncbi:MAG: hypothetical protein R6V75_07270 [Bacteroidales bacterium]